MPRKVSEGERLFLEGVLASGLPEPVAEHRFHPTRKWRFDFAWPEYMVAVEIEGGTWTGGRHNTGKGMDSDMEKYNAAALMGWMVLRFSTSRVKDGVAVNLAKYALFTADVANAA